MAASIPSVQVFQDTQNASVAVALPTLPTVVVGACYDIEDYLQDKANLLISAIGSSATAPTGSASAGTTLSATTVPALFNGAILDNSSAALFVDAGLAEITAGTDGTCTSGLNTFGSVTNFTTAGVLPGDRIVISLNNPVTVNVAKTVLTVSGTSLTTTTNFFTAGTDGISGSGVTAGAYTGITLLTTAMKFRIERPVLNTKVSTAVVAATNQVSTGSAIQVLVAGVAKTVTAGNLYAAYRALRTDLSTTTTTITSIADITNLLGFIDERNPLAVAASIALENSSTQIQVLGLLGDNLNGATDTLVQHTAASAVLNMLKNVYCIVPLTSDISTITMWKNYCRAVAAPAISKFRIVIGSGIIPLTQQVFPATSTNAGTVETNDGTHRNLLDNTATFMTSGVAVNDNVVISAVSYPVTAVLSENRVTVLGQPTTGAATYSIQRTLNRDQQVTALSAVTAGLKDSRCTMVLPDQCLLSGVKNNLTGIASIQPGYYISAAVGGMVAGLPPHQGLTFIGMAGISQVFHSSNYFSDSQIATLSSNGWYIVVQDSPVADPYSIHELTTDTTTIQSGELMITKNFDYVSLTYQNAFRGFLGIYNVIPSTTQLLTTTFNAVTSSLIAQRFPKIGSPLLSANLNSIAPLAGTSDRIEIFADVSLPSPLDTIGLHLTA